MNAPDMTTREAWLTLFAEKYLWPRIEAAGGARPEKYRVSVGFPKGGRGGKGHRIGECWSHKASADATHEIFVSPELPASMALGVLAHELCHASAGVEHGHKAPFKRLAVGIGLTGPMRSTEPGKELATCIEAWLAAEPPYPHAPLSPFNPKGKPGSRLIKAICEGCGYTVRLARQWAEVAAPVCPDPSCEQYQEAMAVAGAGAFKRREVERLLEPRLGLQTVRYTEPA